jgi:hypothetical protein
MDSVSGAAHLVRERDDARSQPLGVVKEHYFGHEDPFLRPGIGDRVTSRREGEPSGNVAGMYLLRLSTGRPVRSSGEPPGEGRAVTDSGQHDGRMAR